MLISVYQRFQQCHYLPGIPIFLVSGGSVAAVAVVLAEDASNNPVSLLALSFSLPF